MVADRPVTDQVQPALCTGRMEIEFTNLLVVVAVGFTAPPLLGRERPE
jgi:hypothetical protein